MKTFRLFTFIVVATCLYTIATPVHGYFATSKAKPDTCTNTVGEQQTTVVDNTTTTTTTVPVVKQGFTSKPEGVLVNCTQPNLLYYIDALLTENLTSIMFVAFIMIIASGIQYMLSGFSPDGAKKSKERIIGIIIGVLFFLSIRLILNQLANNIVLPNSEAPASNPQPATNPVPNLNPPGST